MSLRKPQPNRYLQLIERVFFENYAQGMQEFTFLRSDLEDAARVMHMDLPKNLGDVIYALRYRIGFPEAILATQPKDLEWIIVPVSSISEKELRSYRSRSVA